MYIIFLIRYDFKRKRHNLDRLLSKESRLEAGFHNIHTHKLNRSRQTRAREKKNTADHSDPILTIRGAKILSNLAACQSK